MDDHLFHELHTLFKRTKSSIETFVHMLEPAVDNATTEKERLYFHHIIEEEEERLKRLEELIPQLEELTEQPSRVEGSSSKWTVGDLRSNKGGSHE
ncbi:hypothetical protein [Mechercharimyces sp. CAU 1602]|uniref:hypothetical protein n=1 Tax=Mechercharimyces sp. CAU 1602 TaxID=2973933 RepID=UPI002162A589|nr:hypothetical protein [Mechercharimyces sp. CAU 1602]MCS1350087.1 hypothetical protein [Mechercharimyces sp. CAU 1602]